jgi:hypothetical protein
MRPVRLDKPPCAALQLSRSSHYGSVSTTGPPLEFPDGDRIIEGYFECPVAFTVSVGALREEYNAVVDRLRVTVTLPSAAGTSMNRPDLNSPQWHHPDHDDSLSHRPELAPFWGRVAIGGPDLSAPPKAVTVNRFRIATTTVGDDDHVRDVGRRLAEAMRKWWADVSAWIEILHGQDLSLLGPVEPGLQFSGATLSARLYSLQGHPIRAGALLPVGPASFGVVWPRHMPIDAEQLQRCISHAEQHGPPSTEWSLVRDANSLCAGQDFRRAVLDAGLAAELAVTHLITGYLTTHGHTAESIESILDRHMMLGKRCQYWITQCGGVLPADYWSRLIRPRNSATHTGRTPSEPEASEAIAVATKIVAQAFPVPLAP